MSVTVSAPGKIHLLGEHVVVYGKPALLSAMNRRVTVRIKNQESLRLRSGKARIKGKKIIIIGASSDNLILKTIEIFKSAFSIKKLPPLEITVTSNIPIGSGLGSSAAISAATIGALMKLIRNSWNPNRINELTYEAEKAAHGNPSGADNTAVVFGGLVWYRKEFEFLKSLWTLPVSQYKFPPFTIIQTGTPEESTRQMVKSVEELYKKRKKFAEGVFQNQETQTKNLLLALKTGNTKNMMIAIRNGQKNLEKLQVVGKFAKQVIKDIEQNGGAAKISGAGGVMKGSGILLAFHPDINKLKKIAEKYKLKAEKINLGEEGIRIEEPVSSI